MRIVLATNLPLFGMEVPLIVVILFVFGAGSIYYFLVGAKKIRPISEEFVSIEDVVSSQQNISL